MASDRDWETDKKLKIFTWIILGIAIIGLTGFVMGQRGDTCDNPNGCEDSLEGDYNGVTDAHDIELFKDDGEILGFSRCNNLDMFTRNDGWALG